MGTSASNSGPRDKTPLLPSWAQGGSPESPAPPDSPPPDSPEPATPAPGSPESDAAQPADSSSEATESPNVSIPAASVTGPWTLARRSMSTLTKGGGTSQRHFRTAARRYVSAKGGSSRAAAASTAGRSMTARIGGFLSDVVSRGFVEAARSLGIENVIGQTVQVVLAAVINAISPSGSTNDDAVARRASSETLRELFEKHTVEQAGIESLDAMTPSDVAETVELSVAGYVYQSWLFDLSQKIEEHAVSENEAVKLERDVKTFVRGLVKLKLDGNKALKIDWNGAEGKTFVREIYEAAYSLLGGKK